MVPVHTNGLPAAPLCLAEDQGLLTAYQSWMRWDKNTKTKGLIQEMADNEQLGELRNHLLKRLQFGTAGLRGRMGPGTSCMNDLLIIQTSQGLASYVANICENGCQRSAVIGYDGRYNSRRFAELSAIAFVNRGFKVYLSSEVCPTPFVPFSVKYLKCSVGVMVTASHNPKEDNGYKVYWGNGAQVIAYPKHKKLIWVLGLDLYKNCNNFSLS